MKKPFWRLGAQGPETVLAVGLAALYWRGPYGWGGQKTIDDEIEDHASLSVC